MRIDAKLRFYTFLWTCILFFSACNFPGRISAPTATTTFTETPTAEATHDPGATAVVDQSSTPTQSQSVTPSLTNSATSFLLPTLTFTPVSTFTPVPPQNVMTTGIEGLVTIVKPSRKLPLGGAAITLYDEKTKDDLSSTITIMDGSYRFTQIPSGKYYLVVVWVISNLGAWPCANEKIPSAGNRHTWSYDADGMPIYVEIYSKTSSNIIVAISTGGFGVSGSRKTIDIPLICNQLK